MLPSLVSVLQGTTVHHLKMIDLKTDNKLSSSASSPPSFLLFDCSGLYLWCWVSLHSLRLRTSPVLSYALGGIKALFASVNCAGVCAGRSSPPRWCLPIPGLVFAGTGVHLN